MPKHQYLIVGGGVAGVTAAETIRAQDAEASIAILSDEPYYFYSRLMLSKPGFFLGQIPFDHIWLKQESWYKEKKIDYYLGKKAVALDPIAKTITLDDGQVLSYEKLLLAIGTEARRWNVPGADKRGVHYLRDLDEGRGIIEDIKTAKRGVTIGGGFVSFEMADMLKLAGVDTTTIIRESYYWEPLLDRASGSMIEKALTDHGIKVIKNAEVAQVLGGERVEGLLLGDGTKVDCDMIVCGIGTLPHLEWLKSAGLVAGSGINTNEYMETNLPDVWAAGDAVEFNDLVLGARVQLGNWANAREHGRIAGLNMLGKKEPFRFVSFYTTQSLGLGIAFVGDVRPLADRTIITRGSPEANAYSRIFILDGEITGATLINRAAELGTLSKLIERDWKVAGHESKLSDPGFDLKVLLANE